MGEAVHSAMMGHWDPIPGKLQILRSQTCLRSDRPLPSRMLQKQGEEASPSDVCMNDQ